MHPPSSGEEGSVLHLISLIAGNVLFATGLAFHGFLYNFYLEALGHTEEVMGHAAAALTLGGLASLLPAGWFADRAGPRHALVIAALVVSTGLAAGAFTERPLPVYLAAIVAGIGFGIWRVTVAPALMRLVPPARRPRAFAWNVGLLVAGAGIWVGLAGAVPEWLGSAFGLERLPAMRVALAVGAGGSALAIILFAVMPRLPRASPDAAHPAAREIRPALGVLPAVGLVWLWMLGPALVGPFLNLFFNRRFGLPVAQVAVLFATANLLWGAIVFASGDLAARIGRRRLLLLAQAFFAPAVWGLSLAWGAAFAVGLFLLQGAVSPIANPLIDQLLLERVPAARHGLVSSWRNAAADLSAMAGASLGGTLLAQAGFSTLLVVGGVVGLAGAAGLSLVWRGGARVSPSPSAASGPSAPEGPGLP